MTSLALLARVLLAVIFAIAGAAKLRDQAGTRETVAAFGVPRSLVAPLAVALPLAELVVAVALLPDALAAWAALAALVLLVAFACAITVSIVRGREPECHCLGRLHSRPTGPSTLARTCALAAAAGFVAWAGFTDHGSAATWLRELSDAETAWLAATGALALPIGLGGWLALTFHRRLRLMHRRLEALEGRFAQFASPSELAAPARAVIDAWPTHGLEPGATAPAFALPSLGGEDVSLDTLSGAGRAVVLLFVDPGSPPCMTLVAEVARWQREHGDRVTFAVISRGDANPMLAAVTGGEGLPVLFQRDREVAVAYRATNVPSAVTVGHDGRIAGRIAVGAIAIEALIAANAADAAGAGSPF